MDQVQYSHASDMVPYEVHCPGCGAPADAVEDDGTAAEPVYKCRESGKLFMVREVTVDGDVFTTRQLDLDELEETGEMYEQPSRATEAEELLDLLKAIQQQYDELSAMDLSSKVRNAEGLLNTLRQINSEKDLAE